MALVQLTKQIANDPDSLKALYQTFKDIEEIPFNGEFEPLYKTFRLKGHGVPASDKYIAIDFARTLNGKTFVSRWREANAANL